MNNISLKPSFYFCEKRLEKVGEEILEYCIKAGSGEITPKAVLPGQDDFIP